MPVAATPFVFMQVMVAVYQHLGRGLEDSRKQAQITHSYLHQTQDRITTRQMEVLSATAMQESDDKALGVFSCRLSCGSHGMLARGSLTAPASPSSRWPRPRVFATKKLH